MNDRDELIRTLAQAVRARAGSDAGLVLPDHWDETVWYRLLTSADVLELHGGEVLVERKEPSDDLYFLVSGTLEISFARASSVSITPLVAMKPGTVVGEVAFFDQHSRSASVWSRGDSVLLRLSRADFDAFRRNEPDLACDLLFALGRVLAERLRRANQGHGGGGQSSAFNAGY